MLRKYFLAILFVPLIKKSFSTNFQAVFGKLNYDGKSTAADLTKLVKILYHLKMYSKCTKKIFFSKIICSTHQKTVFLQSLRQFMENWIVDGKSTAASPYKNGENFVLSQNVLRKYFLAKFFVPLIKRSVSTNF